MIAELYDVVDKKMSEMSSQFEAQLESRLTNCVKEGMVEFHRCLWSWSVPVWKRVVWIIRRLVQERRGHGKVEMEVGFVDQCVESNVEPIQQLVVVDVEIYNFVDVGIEIGFHDQLVISNMEIVEHLVMDNLLGFTSREMDF